MKKEDLRIIFMGTPEFAVETLRALVENHYNVVAVVTQPDKPVGRHQTEMQPSEVKKFAVAHNLPVLQPEKMKDPVFVEQLRSYNANLQVVVAFRMLPEVVWAMPKYGTFNVHAALLPQYRGAAPINWAIINGQKRTGVTTFFLDHDIDTGRIIKSMYYDINQHEDVEQVYKKLMLLAARICTVTIELIIANNGHPITKTQDDIQKTWFKGANSLLKPAPKIFRETCEIRWRQQTAKCVYDFVRGLSPYPGAWTTLVSPDGKETVLKLYKTTRTLLPATEPGRISADKRHLYISCKDALLQIDELQLAGKKRMDATSFINGIKDIENYFAR